MHLMCLCKKINVGLYIINCHQPQKSSIGLKNAPKSEKVAVLQIGDDGSTLRVAIYETGDEESQVDIT